MSAAPALVEAPTKADLWEIPLGQLYESPLNPRKTYDPVGLAELAESLKSGQLNPVLVRLRKGGGYELAAGHRRRRAAQKAGLTHLLALVREMSDEEFLKILVVENQQRADLTALEEATGFQSLLKLDGQKYDVPAIADLVGKSKEYVYARLKLLELVPEAQKALGKGEMSPGHAILIARLQPADQVEMMKRFADSRRFSQGETMSVRNLQQQVEQVTKQRAAEARVAAALEQVGKDAVKISDRYTGEKGVKSPDDYRPAKKGEKGAVQAVVVQSWNQGRLGEVRWVKLEKDRPARSSDNFDVDRYKAQQRAAAERVTRAKKVRRRLLEAIVPKLPKQLGREELLLVLRGYLREMHLDTQRAVCQLRGLEAQKKGQYGSPDYTGSVLTVAAALPAVDLVRLLLTLPLMADLEVYSYQTPGKPQALLAAAKAYGVDALAIEREEEAEHRAKKVKQTSAKRKRLAGDVRRRKAKKKAKAS